jgi:hypothetical protein
VVSFDIGTHTYIGAAKANIDRLFPGRHTLIIGDSREAVPRYHDEHPGDQFDLVFIDGGHEYAIARADLENFRALSHRGTTIIMDDLIPWMPWGKGPFQAWADAQSDGLLVQESLLIDGHYVDAITPPARRAWGVGHYVMKTGGL